MPRITSVPVPTTITELTDLSEQINQAISSETLPDGITLQGNSDGTITWIPPTTEEYNTGIDPVRFGSTSSENYYLRNAASFASGFQRISNREAERELERRAELEREQRQIDEAQATWRNALNAIPSSRNRGTNFHQAVEATIQGTATNTPVKEKPVIEEFNYYKHFGALVAE